MGSGLPFATTTSVRYLNLVDDLRLGPIIPVEGRTRGRLGRIPEPSNIVFWVIGVHRNALLFDLRYASSFRRKNPAANLASTAYCIPPIRNIPFHQISVSDVCRLENLHHSPPKRVSCWQMRDPIPAGCLT